MPSKVSLIWAILIIFLGQASCNLNIDDKPVDQLEIQIGTQFKCVSELGPSIKKYLDNELSKEKLIIFVDCIRYSVEAFETYTKGGEQDFYTPQELRLFLESYFFPNRKITDLFLGEVMKAKTAIFGGTVKAITRDEFHTFLKFIDLLKTEAIRIQPFVARLNVNYGLGVIKNGKKLPSVKESIRVLAKSAQKIGASFKGTSDPFDIDGFSILLTELRKFVNWESSFENPIDVNLWVDLLKSYKKLILATDRDKVYKNEWEGLLFELSSWYSIYLRYKYTISSRPILFGIGLAETANIADDLMDNVRRAIKRQKNKSIEFSDIHQLTASLEALGLVPMKIKARTLEKPTEKFIQRMLGDTYKRASQRLTVGLGLPQLYVLYSEFQIWYSNQKILSESFQPELQIGKIDPKNFNGHFEIFKKLKNKFFTKNNPSPHKNKVPVGLSDGFKHAIERNRPLYRNGETRIFLVEKSRLAQHEVVHGFYNLSMMNNFNSFVRFILRGYAEDPNRFLYRKGITSQELQNFNDDFRYIATELKLSDPRNKGVGHRSFIETKLFTFSADGWHKLGKNQNPGKNHIVRPHQLTEFFMYLLSGASLSNKIYKEFVKEDEPNLDLCERGELGVLKKYKIDRSCFSAKIRPILTEHLKPLPYMQQSIENMSEKQWQSFSNTLLTTVRNEFATDKWLESGEIDALSVVTQYIETTMVRYDKNSDKFIDDKEAKFAFPIFKGILRKITQDMNLELSEWDLEQVFYWILENKEIPEPGYAIKWDSLKGSILGWDIHLDRSGMATVFTKIFLKILGRKDTRTADPLEKSSLESGLNSPPLPH